MELRKDYILDRWVYYASERKNRPREFIQSSQQSQKGVCVFCAGNESLTPPEIGRVSEKGKWIIRWFENKFPAVDTSGTPEISKNGLFVSSSAYGRHEIIVEHPEHNTQLWNLSQEHLEKLISVYKQRQSALMKNPNTKYVVIFKNHGKDAGTSLVHSHTQIVSLNILPSLVNEEVNAVSKHKHCPYCEIIKAERSSKRKCFENKYFIAIAPYASRFNYEVWIFPKWHVKSLVDIDDKKLGYHVEILNKVMKGLKRLNCSYNLLIHYAPEKKDLHYHIEVLPRIATWAGFEFATNSTINSVMPEDAAEFYRE